jgi:hypothetical protein
MTHHLVGAAEAAKILGVTRQRVAQLAVTPGFPQPEAELSAGRIWSRHAIERWAVDNQRDRGSAGPPDASEFLLGQIERLAGVEAEAAGSGWVGVEHAVVAMLRPDAPGVAGDALRSLGVTLDEARATLRRVAGGQHEGLRPLTPRLTTCLEGARRLAVELSDPETSSHHLLLAILDDAPTGNGVLDRVDADALRQKVVELSESAPRDEGPDGEWLARRERSQSWKRATGVVWWESLRRRSDGVDQRDRKPWGSVLFSQPDRGRPSQYSVDRDGVPVIASDGRPLSHRVTQEGFVALDEQGRMIEEPFDLPAGVELKWPPGFAFPYSE